MIFNEAGVYPGIPGQFANVHVTIALDGQVLTRALVQHPAFEPAPTVEASADAPTADIPATAPEEPAAEASPLTEQVEPEQPAEAE